MWVIGSMSVCGPASDLPNSSLLLVCHSDGGGQTSTHAIGKKIKSGKKEIFIFSFAFKTWPEFRIFLKVACGNIDRWPIPSPELCSFSWECFISPSGGGSQHWQACGNIDSCCLSLVTDDFQGL